MKAIVLIVSFLVSAVSFAATVEVELLDYEIPAAIELFNRVEAPLYGFGPCVSQEVVIATVTMGFNPSQWTAIVDGVGVEMTDDEITAAIQLFDRAGVPLLVEGIQMSSIAKVQAASCGFNPNRWTLIFDTLE